MSASSPMAARSGKVFMVANVMRSKVPIWQEFWPGVGQRRLIDEEIGNRTIARDRTKQKTRAIYAGRRMMAYVEKGDIKPEPAAA